MYSERNELEEFPFMGTFYKTEIDTKLPLDKQVEKEVVVLQTDCDIQESNRKMTGTITAMFEVYFPFDKDMGINLKRGVCFRGELYGLEVDGMVYSVIPTQMGGCVAYIVDKDV